MQLNADELPIVISLVYYAFFLFLGILLRTIVRLLVPTHQQTYWLNVVTSFSALACSLENGHVRKEYGYGAYIAVVYVLITWHSLTVRDSSSNPVSNAVAFAQGKYNLGRASWLTTAQILGALLSYRAAHMFWGLGLCFNHRQRYSAVTCQTDLGVSTFIGFLLESGGTAFDVLLSLTAFTNLAEVEVAMKSLIMCLLTAAAVHLTGFYLNPVNASNQSIGCTGTTLPEHIFVYWFGPIFAAYLATIVHPQFERLISRGDGRRSSNDATKHNHFDLRPPTSGSLTRPKAD